MSHTVPAPGVLISMSASFLTLQDLNARGWSSTMIRRLLGTHDQERFINRLGHPTGRPIRLYWEARVVALEGTDEFVRAQKQAQAHQVLMTRAKHTRQAGQVGAVTRYEALSLPEIRVYPITLAGRPSTDPQLWKLYLQGFYVWQARHERVLVGVPKQARRAAEQRMLQRYRGAVDQAYGWPPPVGDVPRQ